MANFDADTLDGLRDVRELLIRTEKHPETGVVIWLVVTDGEVFVRSWSAAKGVGTGISRGAGLLHRILPRAGWRCRRSRRTTPMRLPAPAANSCGNISRARMRARWCAPKS